MRHEAGSDTTAARRGRHDEQGSSILEFALVLPVLLAMVFCIIEVGNMYFASSTLDKAASVAARFAVTGVGHDDGTRTALIKQAAKQVTASLPGTANVSVSSWAALPATGEGRTGDPGCPCELMEVKVSYGYTPVTPIIGDLLGAGTTLTGTERAVNEPWLPCN